VKGRGQSRSGRSGRSGSVRGATKRGERGSRAVGRGERRRGQSNSAAETCAAARGLIALAAAGAVAETEAELVRRHAEECPGCARRLKAQRGLVGMLEADARELRAGVHEIEERRVADHLRAYLAGSPTGGSGVAGHEAPGPEAAGPERKVRALPARVLGLGPGLGLCALGLWLLPKAGRGLATAGLLPVWIWVLLYMGLAALTVPPVLLSQGLGERESGDGSG